MDTQSKIKQPINTKADHPDLAIGGKTSPFSSYRYNLSTASLTSYTTHSTDNGFPGQTSVVTTTISNTTTRSSSLNSSITTSKKHKKSEGKMVTSLRSFLMVLALSIHSIFEGMTIGLEETESGVWKLFLAVSLHATAIVFCIGTEMIAMNTRIYKIVMYMVVLSIVSPIGVLIGIIVTLHMDQASGEQVLVIGVLQGLAGGTLLYITFFEVLAKDKLSKYGMSGIMGAFTLIMGFIAMTVMDARSGGHSHGGHVHMDPEELLMSNNIGHLKSHMHEGEQILNVSQDKKVADKKEHTHDEEHIAGKKQGINNTIDYKQNEKHTNNAVGESFQSNQNHTKDGQPTSQKDHDHSKDHDNVDKKNKINGKKDKDNRSREKENHTNPNQNDTEDHDHK